MRSLARRARRAREEAEEDQTRSENRYAGKVTRRGPAAKVMLVGRIISTEQFHERTHQRVANEVSAEYLPVEFLALVKPGKTEVQKQIQK